MKKFWLAPAFCLFGGIAYLVAGHHQKSDEAYKVTPAGYEQKIGPGSKLRGKVSRVLDGDTFELLIDEQPTPVRVRLTGIDAPEKEQPFGQRARQSLASMVNDNPVAVDVTDIDRYGRLLGTVYTKICAPACLSVDVNAEQVKNGMAWAYRFHNKAVIPAMLDLETKARNKNIGLWSDPNAVEPWKWRHQMKSANKTTLHEPE